MADQNPTKSRPSSSHATPEDDQEPQPGPSTRIHPELHVSVGPPSNASAERAAQWEAERSALEAKFGTTVIFINELIALQPDRMAEILRSPATHIAGPMEDYGTPLATDDRPEHERLIRPIQAINRELFRLANLRQGALPLHAIATSYPELHNIILERTSFWIRLGRTPAYLPPLSRAERARAKEHWAAISKCLKQVRNAGLGASLDMEDEDDEFKAFARAVQALDVEDDAPPFVVRFRNLVKRSPIEALKAENEAAFPRHQEAAPNQSAALAAAPDVIIYPPPPENQLIVDLVCPKARQAHANQQILDITGHKSHEWPWCKVHKCKFNNGANQNQCKHVLDDIAKVFAQYRLEEARQDIQGKQGRFDCREDQPLKIVVLDDTSPQSVYEEDLAVFLEDVYNHSFCSVYNTPWNRQQLEALKRAGKTPQQGVTAVTLASLSGHIAILCINYPGLNHAPEKIRIPEEVAQMLASTEVIKCQFGLAADRRLESLGVVLQCVVDLTNVAVLAFPQQGVAPGSVLNNVSYVAHQLRLPHVPCALKNLEPHNSHKPKKPIYADVAMNHLEDDFAAPVENWPPRLLQYIKLVHYTGMALVTAMAVKAAEASNLGPGADVLPFIHYLLLLVEGKPRFGEQSRAAGINVMPFGPNSPLTTTAPDQAKEWATFYLAPNASYLNTGALLLVKLTRLNKLYALSPDSIDAKFKSSLETIFKKPLEFVTLQDAVNMVFVSGFQPFHFCGQCGGVDHAEVTECPYTNLKCIYPRCGKKGHTIATCPYVLIICTSCNKMGHVNADHDVPFPVLQMEHLFACLVHNLAIQSLADLLVSISGPEDSPVFYVTSKTLSLEALPLCRMV